MNSRGADYGGHSAGSNTEMAEVLNRLQEIVSVPGVDFCQIGPGDLSASMSLTGTVNHPEVAAAVDRIRRACLGAGVTVGMTVDHPSYSLSYDELREQGFKALIVGNDAGMLLKGFQSRVRELRPPVSSSVGGGQAP